MTKDRPQADRGNHQKVGKFTLNIGRPLERSCARYIVRAPSGRRQKRMRSLVLRGYQKYLKDNEMSLNVAKAWTNKGVTVLSDIRFDMTDPLQANCAYHVKSRPLRQRRRRLVEFLLDGFREMQADNQETSS